MLTRPPIAKRLETATGKAGRLDPYAWLRGDNWREVLRDPSALGAEIRAYLEAENSWTKQELETPLLHLQQSLLTEMRSRICEDDAEPPLKHGPYAYYRKYRKNGEHPVLMRKQAALAWDESAPETVLLDGEAQAEGCEYFHLGHVEHSPDHRMIAWSEDLTGSEFYTLKCRNIATDSELILNIPDTWGDFVWASNSDGLYWIERNADNRPEKIFWRALGSNKDILVYAEPDAGFFLSIDRSTSGRFIIIRSNDHETAECRIIKSGSTSCHLVARRRQGIEYDLVDHDGRLFILTNDQAEDFRIVSADYDSSDPAKWKEIVPHRQGIIISEMTALADHLIRLERHDGLERIIIRERHNGNEYIIAPGEDAAFALNIISSLEYDTNNLRFSCSSPARPRRVIDYELDTRKQTIRKIQQIPSGHDPEDYLVERMEAPAHDGASIPITSLRHKDTNPQTAPLLLYGYGAYGINIKADFRSDRLSLVDRGFIYAIAHIRGGKDKGYSWYRSGKLHDKPNSFHDYLSVARHLIRHGHAHPGKLIAMGGSAGGLLIGAVANMEPELFAGMIAAVPFVDVLNTMSDAELPLTPPEWKEWGNPLLDPAARETICSYSPYEQTSNKPYPALLITGGLTDPRVTWWEPAKWVAKLRHEAPSGGPYFLRTNMEAGHGGASGRFESLRETALEYAFALAAAGQIAAPWSKE